jgi:hypothetical protein
MPKFDPEKLRAVLPLLGFKIEGTGGGCDAWILRNGDARIMVTAIDDPSADFDARGVAIGFYADDEDEGFAFECK